MIVRGTEMVANPTLESRIAQIRNLVAQNELNEATRRAMDLADDFAQRQATRNRSILMVGAFNDTREREFTEPDAATVARAQLRKQILEFADLVAEECEAAKRHELVSDRYDQRPDRTRNGPVAPSPEGHNTYPRTELEKAKQTHAQRRQKQASPLSPDLAVVATAITKTFTQRSATFTLAPMDLELRLGQITAVVGENGNGKSTILRIVAGTLAPDAGCLAFPSISASDSPDMVHVKRRIAYIPQELPEWHGLLLNHLHLSASTHGVVGKENEDEVDFILHRLGLEAFQQAEWGQISGGYRTRFELAKMMVWHPDLLVLDEPLANLDINTQLLFLQDLRSLADSIRHPMAALISSQHLHEVEAVANNIIFVQEGTVRYNGAVADVGSDREENSFEVACDLSKDKLLDVFEGSSPIRLEKAGFHYIIHTPITVRMQDIMARFAAKEIEITYLRDISRSTRKLFHVRV